METVKKEVRKWVDLKLMLEGSQMVYQEQEVVRIEDCQ
jgi:hypothetical protein